MPAPVSSSSVSAGGRAGRIDDGGDGEPGEPHLDQWKRRQLALGLLGIGRLEDGEYTGIVAP